MWEILQMNNDFTKEELEHILHWANIYTEFGSSWIYEMHMPVINKILSMIENHCEHKFCLQGCGSNAYAQCFKCGYIPKGQNHE